MLENRACTVKLSAPPEEVYNALQGRFGNVYSKRERLNGHFFGVIIGEKYFFRVNSYVAISIVISGKGNITEVDVTAAGGYVGFLRIDYGVHMSYMLKVVNEIEKEIHEKRLSWQIISKSWTKRIKNETFG